MNDLIDDTTGNKLKGAYIRMSSNESQMIKFLFDIGSVLYSFTSSLSVFRSLISVLK